VLEISMQDAYNEGIRLIGEFTIVNKLQEKEIEKLTSRVNTLEKELSLLKQAKTT
jgi:hypothetical protein